MRVILIIVLSVSFISSYSQGEQYNFSKIDTYTGLSHNQVSAILRDREGFIWFGTLSGLNRFDGSSIRVFRSNYLDSSSLPDNSIQSLFELPDGKMWVATMGGACIYSSQSEKFNSNYREYLKSIGLPENNISTIVKGHKGRYWFLYSNSDIYVYSAIDKKARPIRQATSNGHSVVSMMEAVDDNLWLLYQNGTLQKYNIAANSFTSAGESLQDLSISNKFNNLFIDGDGDIWLWALNSGIYYFNPRESVIKKFSKNGGSHKLNTNLVTQIVQDNSGLIWIATDHGGINLINKKNDFEVKYLLNDPNDPRSLSQNSIITMYKDSSGILWLGTYKQGINYLNSNVLLFPLYRQRESNKNSLPYDDVNRFVEDKNGNIWIGTNGGGLIFFDRKQNTFKQYLHDPKNKNSLSNNVIVSLCIDHDNILWIGTYFGGLLSFDGRTFTQYRHSDTDSNTIANDNIWEIYEDRDWNLWIGTLGGGLDVFNRKTKRFRHYKYTGEENSALPSNFVSSVIQNSENEIWVGSSGGVTIFERSDSDKFIGYTLGEYNDSLSTNNVICLFEDSKKRMWVGTKDGLNLYDKQRRKFRSFTVSDGLPDDFILNILEDNRRTLWISTPSGLFNIIPGSDSIHFSFSIVNYDETNNLQNREFNDNAALKTKSGELIFGGPSGFNIIDPDRIQTPSDKPKILFTSLQILNNTIEPGEIINDRVLLPASLAFVRNISLKYKENIFTIEFSCLDFGQTKSTKYAYKLEGFNADWLFTDRAHGRATFTNINPGSYTFKVKVLSKDGKWSNEEKLSITIEPPLWKTNLAYLFYFLVATSLFLLIRKITLERIRMRFEVQQQKREAERAYSLDQLKTKFFTNVSHEFRTPLSLIIAPLEKLINNSATEDQKTHLTLIQRNAKRLLGLVNQLLDFRKLEVQEMKLHLSIGDIIEFSREIGNSFVDIAEKRRISFSFSSTVEQLEIYFDKDKVEKILFNLLSNAFKYTHDEGRVDLNVRYDPPQGNEENGIVTYEIQDNGIGIPQTMQEKIFERFFQTDLPASMVNQGTGIGLAITKEFVKLHKGVITVKSEPEKGTCFTVLLPARRINELGASISTGTPEPLEQEQTIALESKRASKKKTILIVDDNEDIRFYLKDNLRGSYKIEEATNGKEGWEKVKEINPDLVVSDIMMPLVDGVELAKRIKNETITAHIPVILLTAVGNEQKQLEGLKAGVNDYITKPFTFEILASRIRNLLAQQDLLRKKFQKQIEIDPAEITITPVDETFLKQALEIVEKNIDNSAFSVEDLSKELFMNRVTLYRKILSITGKTPIEFIRSIRMKRAAHLLEKSGMSIAEIGYEVGFNNPKNFAKAFKEEFKIPPSQYVAAKKNGDLP